jgi:excisionase family DNA binding protein
MTEDFNPTEWITTKEVAELTGYTQSYIGKAISRGRLNAEKIGRDWLLRKEDVLKRAEKVAARPGEARFLGRAVRFRRRHHHTAQGVRVT